MRMSEEERRRAWEEEQNQFRLPGITYREYDRLTPRQQSHEWQKYTQRITSHMGFWKTCNLSPCRRARACKGFLTEAQYGGDQGWHDAFPPCVGPGGARHQEVMDFLKTLDTGEDDDEPKYDGRQHYE